MEPRRLASRLRDVAPEVENPSAGGGGWSSASVVVVRRNGTLRKLASLASLACAMCVVARRSRSVGRVITAFAIAPRNAVAPLAACRFGMPVDVTNRRTSGAKIMRIDSSATAVSPRFRAIVSNRVGLPVWRARSR